MNNNYYNYAYIIIWAFLEAHSKQLKALESIVHQDTFEPNLPSPSASALDSGVTATPI